MKKLLLSTCFILACITMNAQVTTKIDSLNSIDQLIKPLDKSTFTTGILYDRVSSIANLRNFNIDKKVTDAHHFEQALSELYRASNQQKFKSVTEFRKKYASKVSRNTVDIGIINTAFNRLNYDKDAEENGALHFDSKKLTPINQESIFKEEQLLLIAPLKKNVVGEKITFNLNTDFVLEETTAKKIKAITADFGTGMMQRIYENGKFTAQSVVINYSQSGHKNLKFETVFEDGTSITTVSKLFVTVSNSIALRNPDDGTEDGNTEASIAFPGYEVGDVAIKGELEYRIFYHGTPNNYERTLLKPIIIVDGFDPGDTRKIEESDYPDDGEEHPDAIETLMSYKEGAEEIPIIEKLREEGFDVVIVNHHTYIKPNGLEIDGGGDYIERNALAHVQLYQDLYNEVFTNGSSEELIVVGPSMGGQISRYALAYMEENNIDHHVKLWVSLDSPHLGANIPLADQANLYFLGYINGNQEAKDKYDFLLNSVAGKQQLILQHSHNGTSEPPYFAQYHTNLESNLPNSKGFPQLTRNIAMVNGSIISNGIYSPAQKVLDIRGFVDLPFGTNHKAFQNENWFTPSPGESGTVYFGKVDEVINSISMTTSLTNFLVFGSLDALPGGMADTQKVLKEAIVPEVEQLVDYVEVRTFLPNHAFVPTVSALAFKKKYFNWDRSIDIDLLCEDIIPFKTFYAPKENEAHTSFTEASVNWLFEELNGNHQLPPSYTNTTVSIDGDAEVFVGQTKIYSISKVAGATSYTWTLDFNYGGQSHTPWQIISGQGTNSITVKVGSPILGVISCKPKNYCATGKSTYMYVRSYNTGGGGGGDDDPCDGVFLKVSPNPNKGGDMTLVIEPIDPCDDGDGLPTKVQTKNTVVIYSLSGRKEYQNVFTSNEVYINGLYLKTGVYVVHVTTATGKKTQQTIVVE